MSNLNVNYANSNSVESSPVEAVQSETPKNIKRNLLKIAAAATAVLSVAVVSGLLWHYRAKKEETKTEIKEETKTEIKEKTKTEIKEETKPKIPEDFCPVPFSMEKSIFNENDIDQYKNKLKYNSEMKPEFENLKCINETCAEISGTVIHPQGARKTTASDIWLIKEDGIFDSATGILSNGTREFSNRVTENGIYVPYSKGTGYYLKEGVSQINSMTKNGTYALYRSQPFLHTGSITHKNGYTFKGKFEVIEFGDVERISMGKVTEFDGKTHEGEFRSVRTFLGKINTFLYKGTKFFPQENKEEQGEFKLRHELMTLVDICLGVFLPSTYLYNGNRTINGKVTQIKNGKAI